MLGTVSQDDLRHFYDRLRVRIHACVAGTLCIDVTVWEQWIIIYNSSYLYNDFLVFFHNMQ